MEGATTPAQMRLGGHGGGVGGTTVWWSPMTTGRREGRVGPLTRCSAVAASAIDFLQERLFCQAAFGVLARAGTPEASRPLA